jgi:hypothetical protein
MPAKRPQLAVISLHVTIEFAGIVWDLDVDWRQAVVIVPLFPALVHASLRNSQYAPASSMSPLPGRRQRAGGGCRHLSLVAAPWLPGGLTRPEASVDTRPASSGGKLVIRVAAIEAAAHPLAWPKDPGSPEFWACIVVASSCHSQYAKAALTCIFGLKPGYCSPSAVVR